MCVILAGCCSGPCQVLLTLPASTQYELAQSFDVNPVREYLERNGIVADDWLASETRDIQGQMKNNISFLSHLNDLDPAVRAMLLNALRQSGQYLLASLLDDGTRILPSPTEQPGKSK